MVVVIRPPDESLKDRPNIFNMIGRTKVPSLMNTRPMEIAPEGINPFITGGSIRPDHTAPFDVTEEEGIRRSLLTVPRCPQDDLFCSSLIGSKDDPLVSMPSSSKEGLVHLNGSLQIRAFVHQVLLKPPEPPSHRHGRDSGDLRRGIEGDLSLPTVNKEPELPEGQSGSLEPGNALHAKGLPAFGASVSVL